MSDAVCPKCSIPVTYQEPMKSAALSWIAGDFAPMIAILLVLVTFACARDELFSVAVVLGISTTAFVLYVIHIRNKPEHSIGQFYCANCQQHYTPENVGG